MHPFKFDILHKSKRSRARVGQIHTPHGVIETPNFVAVGTNGTLKALDNAMVTNIGLQLMFCNTYHLLVQPGVEVIRRAGGIHNFINCDLPIITDSGGFQVFSLAYGSVSDELKGKGAKRHKKSVLKVTDEGVSFRSYLDGRTILLTPESSISMQKSLGADIIIPLDELPPYHIDQGALKRSLERTHRWEKRSLDVHLRHPNNQAIYAVIHGGVNDTLREKSCSFLKELPFDGFAIGGSMGNSQSQMLKMLDTLLPKLPSKSPNHLLGIADLKSIEACIPFGIDTFDSSYPTKVARHGTLFTHLGGIKISKRHYRSDFEPIQSGCGCFTCENYSRAYLHHLFKAKELNAMFLASTHNLHFMIQLMRSYRRRILSNSL